MVQQIAFVEYLEDRLFLSFANWSSIGPAIALVPMSAGPLASASVVNFGTTVYTGPLNVANTLNRIRADGTPLDADDGIVYNNTGGQLPAGGTYYEFVTDPSTGTDHNFGSQISFPGPMRILLNTGGNCYFTGDHYSTFKLVSAPSSNVPTIGTFTISPSSITIGTASVGLTAGNVTESGGTINSVSFYRESNGTAGLQIGSDTLIGGGVQNGNNWTTTTSTGSLTAGSYTYYAVATDASNVSSAAASAALTVNPVATGSAIAAWNVTGQSAFGTQGLGATSLASGITSSLGLTRAGGLTTSGTAAGDAWGAANWASTSAAGVTGNQFVTFGLSVSSGYTASISSLDLNYRHSSRGPASGDWQYELNSGPWTEIGNFANQFSSSSSSGAAITEMNLAGVSGLQNLPAGTSVAFRLVAYGASDSGGTWYVYDLAGNDLEINGSVAPVVTTQPLVLTGPANTLKLDADGLRVDVWNNATATGSPAQQVLLSQISTILFAGEAGDDSLMIDFSAGDPLVSSGMTFNGGTGGNNVVSLIGTTGDDTLSINNSTATFTAGFGSVPITYSGTTSIHFNGMGGLDTLAQTAQPAAGVFFDSTTASDALNVNAGTFTLPGGGASLTTFTLGALNIAAGATATVTPAASHAARTLLSIGSLSLAGTLDLTQNELLTAATVPTVQSYLTGGQLVTSDAAGVLGYLDAGGGQTEVMFTILGDTNLDGTVNVSDLGNLATSFGSTSGVWVQGDFDRNGIVNVADLGDLATNFGQSLGGGASNANSAAASTLPLVSATHPQTTLGSAFNSSDPLQLPSEEPDSLDDLLNAARTKNR